ncbi:NAD(P)-binding protein [Phanerochaete sordida]|uniref:NAD(P)-binding protein n=1 Tax=Phanerochaete sordida TaxID=48140 RepID=A0A9P3LLT7_9APHY|nr:NAD(P)-binding protein [Phanerochaete sordida]
MPAVLNGNVLVSGCNGFVAVWVVKQLLEEGYAVRGTVRRESAIPYLKELFKSYDARFEVVIVPDITKDGAFDDAVKGIDAIVHLASPFHMRAEDPQEIIGPAVAGTASILRSALAHGNDTVRRFVILSSCAAVLTESLDLSKSRTFSEADWNEFSIRDCAENGSAAYQVNKYHASKALAERAAWEFAAEHKGTAQFDVVALNPPYVFGPWLHDVAKPEQLNASMLAFWDAVIKGNKTMEQFAVEGQSWVDVRDIAHAIALTLQRSEAGGERIIVSAGPWNWQNFVTAAHNIDPSLPAGNTSYDPKTAIYQTCFENGKSTRVLGIEYRSLEECTESMVAQFKAKGWM